MLPFMFLSNDLTYCNRDGYGSMSNLLRASVSLALHYNLTYVHREQAGFLRAWGAFIADV